MDYFKVNYNKLRNMKQINFFIIVVVWIIVILFLILLASKIYIYDKIVSYGVYSNKILTIKINNNLSDKIKNSDYITFNNQKTDYQIHNFTNFEVIDDKIFQEVNLIIDDKFYDNEIGKVVFYHHKKSILKYILNLFK